VIVPTHALLWSSRHWKNHYFPRYRSSAFCPELYKSRVFQLNASDDRGINVVQTNIKDFPVVAVGTNRPKVCELWNPIYFLVFVFSPFFYKICVTYVLGFWYFSGYPCPPYKIIFLDKADSMTEDAQVCFFCF